MKCHAVGDNKLGAPANAGGLGLLQRQHHLCRDGRIDRRTTIAQHGKASLRRVRFGRHDHMMLRQGSRRSRGRGRGHKGRQGHPAGEAEYARKACESRCNPFPA